MSDYDVVLLIEQPFTAQDATNLRQLHEDIEDLRLDRDQAISSPDLAGTDIDLEVTEGVSTRRCRVHPRSLSPPGRLPCRGDCWVAS